MIRHILLRVLYTLPALWLILTMVFLMIHIVPGDPVLQMLGQDARAEDLTLLRHSLGLDQPLGVQYARYLEGLAPRRLGPLDSLCRSGALDRAGPLSRDARIVPGGPDCLRRDCDSRRRFLRVAPGQPGGPRDFVFHPAGTFGSQFRARSRADSGVFGGNRVAAGIRTRRRKPSDPACRSHWARRSRRFSRAWSAVP